MSDLPPLSCAQGQAALAALARRPTLFAFDFDGTLAPIQARPADVRIAPDLAERLARLARRRPVAIVTGRQIADVRGRLGFTPTWIVGNHGAEDDADPDANSRAFAALEPLRTHLRAHARDLGRAGVTIEDKRQSLALHFRTAPDPVAAAALIEQLLADAAPALHVFGGKLVVNAVAADAPDKAAAVSRLLARAGLTSAFFAGDDLNDEPVFRAARADWLTVRVGCDSQPSAALFCLEGPDEMAGVLDGLLAAMGEAG
jgi:trehalose 6-phosphate phosphatase